MALNKTEEKLLFKALTFWQRKYKELLKSSWPDPLKKNTIKFMPNVSFHCSFIYLKFSNA